MPTGAEGYSDLPAEVHGLHHGLSCLLDRNLILLTHCDNRGAEGQFKPPLPGLTATQPPTNVPAAAMGGGLQGTHLTG